MNGALILDLAIGALGVLALYRGYRRGFLRTMANLAAVVAGAYVALRASEAAGDFVMSWANIDPLAAQAAAGLAIFAGFLVAGWLISTLVVRTLGPLRLLDRLAGAVTAVVLYGVFMALTLLMVTAFSFNPTVDDILEESEVARLVAGDSSSVKTLVSRVSGNRVVESLINLKELLEDQSVVIDMDVSQEIPRSEGSDLVAAVDAAQEVDLVIEVGAGKVIGIEIKAASGVDPHDARHLAWLRDELGDRFVAGVVLHTGSFVYPLGERITAAPISTLWA